jgi:hypothetical protein
LLNKWICKLFSDCGVPVIDNGNVDYPSGTLFDESVTVTCNAGYNITGDTTWTCADLGWNGKTTCVILGTYSQTIMFIRKQNDSEFCSMTGDTVVLNSSRMS